MLINFLYDRYFLSEMDSGTSIKKKNKVRKQAITGHTLLVFKLEHKNLKFPHGNMQTRGVFVAGPLQLEYY